RVPGTGHGRAMGEGAGEELDLRADHAVEEWVEVGLEVPAVVGEDLGARDLLRGLQRRLVWGEDVIFGDLHERGGGDLVRGAARRVVRDPQRDPRSDMQL